MKLKNKLLMPSLVMIIIIISQILVTMVVLNQKKFDGVVINLAGRQRMLSQKMAKEALIINNFTNQNISVKKEIDALKSSIKTFDKTLIALSSGEKAPLTLNLNSDEFLKCCKPSSNVNRQLGAVKNIWIKQIAQLKKVIEQDNNYKINEIVFRSLSLLEESNTAVVLLEKESERRITFLIFVQIITFIVAVIAFVFAIFISNRTANGLSRVIESTTASVKEFEDSSYLIASSSQQMAQCASEQAKNLGEVSNSVDVIIKMTKENVKNTKDANQMGESATKVGNQSKNAVVRMNSAMEKIKNSSDETAQIIKTIDAIAMQTNLLALNAAVEAARAGDAGRGFAVVAEEVRSLAQRSAEAAKNTTGLIVGMQENSENGITVLRDVDISIGKITNTIGEMSILLNKVSTGSAEQVQDLNQINEAINKLNQVTQNNAASSEETASASEELSAQSKELSSDVNTLKIIVGESNSYSGGAQKIQQDNSLSCQVRKLNKVDKI